MRKRPVFSSSFLFFSSESRQKCFWHRSTHISDDSLLKKLAYLSDIFGKPNELNLQLQRKDKHLPQVTNKIGSFTQKVAMWGRQLDEGNGLIWEPAWICILLTMVPPQWFSTLSSIFHHWWDSFNFAEDDQFIDMTSDSTIETEFHITDSEWNLSLEKQYPLFGAENITENNWEALL